MKAYRSIFASATILVALAACDTGGGGENDDNTCDLADPNCSDGLVCNTLADGTGICAEPVLVQGTVVELATGLPIEGARVQAVDVNGAAVGTSGVTDADGAYQIEVPAIRDEHGAPIDGEFTLRVQAATYQQFPTAIRPALPIDVSTAVSDDADEGLTVENALTIVALISLPGDTSVLGSISGTVSDEGTTGVLIVADGDAEAFTGFSDSDGNYVIFNVPAGSYTVRGYSAGLQLDAAAATVEASVETTDIDLATSDNSLSAVSGSVQIVNAPGGAKTSVVLAIESTFEEAAGRGAVPPGLRAADIDGSWSIPGVPDGSYVVLAAFENDDLVRDPDQTIGGTAVVRITVPDPDQGNAISISEGFKVTEALEVVSPGSDAPEQVTTLTPTFEWADDSSEDGYEVRVFDAFGQLVTSTEVGGVSGSETVTYTYDGPALETGTFYQFRVTSFRDRQGGRSNISASEDLRGVFYFVAD